MTTLYCFDASALITAHDSLYPKDVFPAMWKKLEETFRGDRVFFCEETFDEIVSGHFLHEWVNEREAENSQLVRETSGEIYACGSQIERNCFSRARSQRERETQIERNRSSRARNRREREKLLAFQNDIFIIAHAKCAGATVVTQETRSGNENAYKIPNVCAHENVQCINFLGFMKNERYRF